MAVAQIRIKTKTFRVGVAGTSETTAVFSVKKGERVLWASAVPRIACTAGKTSAMIFGDGDDDNGYITTFTVTAAASPIGTPIGGGGALFNQAGGKLYTADDTIDVVATEDATNVIAPAVTFSIATIKERLGVIP